MSNRDNSKTLTIPQSRDNMVRDVGICVVFVAVAIWMILFPATILDTSMGRWIILLGGTAALAVRIIGILATLFFVAIIFERLKAHKSSEPAIKLSPLGLSIRVGPAQFNDLPWSEVKGARIVEFANNKWVVVVVSHPARLIMRQRGLNLLIILITILNHLTYGTPVFVSNRSIDGDLYSLLMAIESYRLAHDV